MTLQQILATCTDAAPAFAPILRDYTTPVASATDTAPNGATQVRICVWGGGNAGYGGDGVFGGSGGDSSGYAESVYQITGGQTLVYTVGAGGSGGAGAASQVTSGSKTITAITASSATQSGGNVLNAPGNPGAQSYDTSGGAGGAAVVGWGGYSAGAGGAGGSAFSVNGSPGQNGRVIFYYT
jgi:hypothetical protein